MKVEEWLFNKYYQANIGRKNWKVGKNGFVWYVSDADMPIPLDRYGYIKDPSKRKSLQIRNEVFAGFRLVRVLEGTYTETVVRGLGFERIPDKILQKETSLC